MAQVVRKGKPSVYIAGGDADYEALFLAHGWYIAEEVRYADLVQFTGGEDVSPELYGEQQHETTSCNRARDAREVILYQNCYEASMPMAGICRGGQFLNVMCGGKMWQDVNNHGLYGTHKVVDMDTSETFEATSTHHQMMRPGKGGEVVARAGLATNMEFMMGDEKFDIAVHDPEKQMLDVESVWYKDNKVLCFQPHPEFDGHRDAELGGKYMEFIRRYLDLEA
jgi:GMP synthase-like glutamine amidotransferase